MGDKIQWDNVPASYKDDRHQIGETLFLEYRSRHDQAFFDQFVGRLGGPSSSSSAKRTTLLSCRALITRCEHVKTLTLLALSANQ